MPAMGDSITEGTVVKWHFQVGDQVEMDDIMCEVETDKVLSSHNSHTQPRYLSASAQREREGEKHTSTQRERGREGEKGKENEGEKHAQTLPHHRRYQISSTRHMPHCLSTPESSWGKTFAEARMSSEWRVGVQVTVEIRAPDSGVVTELCYAEGDTCTVRETPRRYLLSVHPLIRNPLGSMPNFCLDRAVCCVLLPELHCMDATPPAARLIQR